jgi:nitrite reductase/ring-hydroxylating ferredoxin subunit
MEINSQPLSNASSPMQPDVRDENQFRIAAVPPGSALLVGDVAVFNVAGHVCATQAKCTHRQGPLSEGRLDGSTVTCPWHGAQFDVCSGAVLRGPAVNPLRTYRVVVDGEIGRVEEQS